MNMRISAGVAALLGIIGCLGLWQAWSTHHTDSASNRAVVDATETSAVQQSATKALTSLLSYDANAPGLTEEAAQTWLVGAARKEYELLYATLEKKAPEQKLTLTAQVQTVGVKEIKEEHASALVFLDQSSQRASDKEKTVSAAQLAVKLVKAGGVWKISSLRPL